KMLEYKSMYETTSEYVFSPVRNNSTKSLNKPLNTSYIYQLVQRVVSKVANGKRATPHSFRKTFIELALNNQEDFISIINATGHSTVEMVKYYDTRDTLKNNAVHGMAKLI
ncbi:MAG: integrase, partial [Arenicella sp.]